MHDAPSWTIIVHGGAKEIAPHLLERHRAGCLTAVKAGAEVLAGGGSAVLAAEAAVRVLESDPIFNAGYGSVLNAQGQVECDAAIMDGSDLSLGAVAAARGLAHPISVASAMLKDQSTLLAGEGAALFAKEIGAELCDPDALIGPDDRAEHGCDTVGCVALDLAGHLAAATSTGGLKGCRVGRVGDSPLPGCGLYAEDGVGAVSLSGEGEAIARTGMAAWLMRALETSPPDQASRLAFDRLAKVGGEAGVIVIDAEGRIEWAHNSRDFAVAYASSALAPRAFTSRAQDPLDNGDTA